MEMLGHMKSLTCLKEQILPIAVVAVIGAIGFFTITKMPLPGTPWGIAEWILMLIGFCVVFSFFPAVAIISSWYTGSRIVAVLGGILIIPPFFTIWFFLICPRNTSPFSYQPTYFTFIAIITAICILLAGYCAAQRTKPFLAVSVLLTGLWLVIWMNGFN